MKRLLPIALLAVSLMGTCANKKYDRLEAEEKEHYTALKVWMDDKERKAYLKLKTREERDAYLKSKGYWDRFYQYDDRMRDLILGGKVHPGWKEDALVMAWGPSHNTKRLAGRSAQRSQILTYLFEVQPDGAILIWTPKSTTDHLAVRRYRVEVILDDGVVAELREREGWQ
jgi:hypothetical protein